MRHETDSFSKSYFSTDDKIMITIQTYNLEAKIWYSHSWCEEKGKDVLANLKSQEAEWYN